MSAEDPTTLEEQRGVLQDLSSFLYLLKFARPLWLKFSYGFFLLVLTSLLAMASARTIGYLVDEGLTKGDGFLSFHLALLIIALESSTILVAYMARRRIAQASLGAILLIRKRLFQHLEELPLSYFDTTPQGRIVTRLTYDVESLEEFFSSTMGKLLGSLIMAGTALVAMFITDIKLASYVAVSVIPSVLLTFGMRRSTRDYNRQISRRNSGINAALSEFLNGISVIRAFALEGWASKKFDTLVTNYLESNIALNRIFSLVRPMIGFLSMLPLILIAWIGGHDVLAGILEVGTLVSFIRYFDRFGRPMMELSLEIHIVQQAFTSAERIARFLHAPTETTLFGIDGANTLEAIKGEIQFSGVTMRYGTGDPALKNISFRVTPGEKVGFTGTTGSGKSSTVSLLLRLYDFESGEILIDGKDIRTLSRESLRTHIGFVSQEVMILKGTLRENLALGYQISDEEIERVAASTGLKEVLIRRGFTLDSELLEQGLNLSVGERQILSFTRILLRSPKILILDEATANIDAAYEKVIQHAVDFAMEGRTCLVIAHRLTTLQHCDKILVFKEGEIVESGNHTALLAKRGEYADLVNMGQGVIPQ